MCCVFQRILHSSSGCIVCFFVMLIGYWNTVCTVNQVALQGLFPTTSGKYNSIFRILCNPNLFTVRPSYFFLSWEDGKVQTLSLVPAIQSCETFTHLPPPREKADYTKDSFPGALFEIVCVLAVMLVSCMRCSASVPRGCELLMGGHMGWEKLRRKPSSHHRHTNTWTTRAAGQLAISALPCESAVAFRAP